MESPDGIWASVDSSVNELKIIHDLIEINSDFADTAAFCEQYESQSSLRKYGYRGSQETHWAIL